MVSSESMMRSSGAKARWTLTLGSFAALLAVSCGPSATQPGAPTTSTPVASAPPVDVTPRDLGALPDGDCTVKTFLTTLNNRCEMLHAARVSGTGDAAEGGSAGDNDACTVWSTGGMAPQVVNVDLGGVRDVSGLLLVPDMVPPDGDQTNLVEYIDEDGIQHSLVRAKASMTSAHGYAVAFPQTLKMRFIRVTTTEASTNVAWRELGAMTCK
jgi:hypothetical protein